MEKKAEELNIMQTSGIQVGAKSVAHDSQPALGVYHYHCT
jgi:hypothetical protein